MTTMRTDPQDPVWAEDVAEQETLALDCWKVTFDFYERMVRQGAPIELIEGMGEACSLFSKAFETLKGIRPYFMVEGSELRTD